MQKLKNCYDPLKIWEAAYLLIVLYTVLLFRRKKNNVLRFLTGQKHRSARGVRFLLRFNKYLFLALVRTGVYIRGWVSFFPFVLR